MSQGSCQPNRVGIMLLEGANPFEIGVATEIFGLDRPEIASRPYELHTCGPTSVTMARGMFTLTPNAPFAQLEDMDTVIVPGHPDPAGSAGSAAITTLQAAAARGARLVSFCSGSLVLGEAGLLDGVEATTHWRYANVFQSRFPAVHFRPDVLFVEAPPIFTAAGSAAALDLALQLVRLDHGEAIANSFARRLVFAAHRSGDQRQFVDAPSVPPATATSIGALQDYVLEHLDEQIRVADLAERSAMSATSFHRWFRAETQQSPQQWVTDQRVRRVRELLETTGQSVENIARSTGLGTASNLRLHFSRRMGTTPTAYRRRFSQLS